MKIINNLEWFINNKYHIVINLTNGLEMFNSYKNIDNLSYCRIASTDLEQHLFNRVISDLDYNLLFNLAVGKPILIIDYSPQKPISRALFQGVVFVEYVLNREWFNKIEKAIVREHNVTKYFEEEYQKLTDESLRKIRYFKKLVTATKLDINVWCGTSTIDNKYDKFKELLKTI